MNAYSSLARFYDRLTADVPYEAFADFYEELFKQAGLDVKTIIDLACGTGSITHTLARRGYELIGTDSSPDMLSIAAEKARDAQIQPLFICQSLEELDLYGTAHAAVCSLDGINYVKPGNIREVFRRVSLFIEPGSLFIFDVNTPEKLRGMDGFVFLDETDDVFCVWRAEFLNDENACFYGMDIFSKNGGLWRREKEEHIEYVYEPQKLCEILIEAGFAEVRLYGELKLTEPAPGEPRVFIAAKK